MATQVTNYQCPTCTGPLHYVGSTGKLQCDYCGSSFDVAEIEALYAEKEAKAVKETEKQEKKAQEAREKGQQEESGDDWGVGMHEYNCPSCGAQLICDETTAATSCPYCGNPTVVPGKFSGAKRPDFVIPFKLSKEDAIAKLKEHYKGKVLLPKVFSKQNHIEEIKGVYVPFWLYDSVADADIDYEATRSRVYSEGDYTVTETDHYDISRAGTVKFERVPVDGSSKMPDDYMDSIEPYDYSELKKFSTAYLPGFLADKYDVDAKEATPRLEERCSSSAKDVMRDSVLGYDTVVPRSENVHVTCTNTKYALMPVWLLSTKWKDKNYLFAMNGQTGKMVGDLPADKKKLGLWFWGVAVGLSVVLSALLSGPIGRLIYNLLH